MKSVKADFNRRGPDGALKVSLRRFGTMPTEGEQFIAVDGEDMAVGLVKSVDPDSRIVLMDMNWGQALRNYSTFSSSRHAPRTLDSTNNFVAHVRVPKGLPRKTSSFGTGELLEA